MKKNTILFLPTLALLLLITSCYEDLGNYDYRPPTTVAISNLPTSIEVLENVDKIIVKPKITIEGEGELLPDNPNYEYIYKIEYAAGGRINSNTPNEGTWRIMNPHGNRELDTVATLTPNNYILWFSVKDKRTNVEYSSKIPVRVISATYEGWLVLCEEGTEKRVRMDYVARLAKDKYVVAQDIFAAKRFPRDIRQAYGVFFHPSNFANPGDRILVMTGSGTFIPNSETFMFSEDITTSNLQYSEFIGDMYTDNHPVYFYNTASGGGGYNLFVSNKGNAFCLQGGAAGPIYQDPINTTKRGAPIEYKLAPYIGVNEHRASTAKNVYSAIFYDEGYKRFVGWAARSPQTTTPLKDPQENKIFSYQTEMDMVYMESTRFSGGVTFAIMQDREGKRHIYGLNYISFYDIGQHSLIENINAPEFNEAKTFAFSSQYAYTYYATGNKVYSYDRGTNTTNLVLTLPQGEEVTRLKFVLTQNTLNPQSENLMEITENQYNLLVGSFNASLGNSGGTMRMMKVQNTDNSLQQISIYNGLGNIVDFAYRERR